MIDCSLRADKRQVLARRFLGPVSSLTRAAAAAQFLKNAFSFTVSTTAKRLFFLLHSVYKAKRHENVRFTEDSRRMPDLDGPALRLCVALVRSHRRDQNDGRDECERAVVLLQKTMSCSSAWTYYTHVVSRNSSDLHFKRSR